MSATLNANLFLDYFRIGAAPAVVGSGAAVVAVGKGGRRAPPAPRALTGFSCTLLSIPGNLHFFFFLVVVIFLRNLCTLYVMYASIFLLFMCIVASSPLRSHLSCDELLPRRRFPSH